MRGLTLLYKTVVEVSDIQNIILHHYSDVYRYVMCVWKLQNNSKGISEESKKTFNF